MTTNNPFPKAFRPMKGALVEVDKLRFDDKVASPKIDGYRLCVGGDGVPYTSSLKPFSNKYIRDYFTKLNPALTRYLDGEIVVGSPCDPEIYKKTTGPVRRAEGEPDFTFWVFDCIDTHRPYHQRYQQVIDCVHKLNDPRIQFVKSTVIGDKTDFDNVTDTHAEQGYEGTMIRDAHAQYKFGRGTVNEGSLLKWKLFADYEGRIVDVHEAMENLNDAITDERGLTKRSTHAENKIGKEMAGTVYVQGLNGPYKNLVFPVSLSTMTHDDRTHVWDNRWQERDKIITFTCLKHTGGYSLPRGAKFDRYRPEWDMSED